MKSYVLPRTIYNQTIWYIRGYPEIKQRLADLIEEGLSISLDEKITKNKISDPTYNKTVARERMNKKINIIDKALLIVPEEYRKDIFNNIVYGYSFPIYATRTTYARHKQKFVFYVAVYSGIYEEDIL